MPTTGSTSLQPAESEPAPDLTELELISGQRNPYTGEQLPNRTREAIVRALQAGMPARAIARAYHCAQGSVAAIRDRLGLSADFAQAETKRELTRAFSALAAESVERLRDDIDKVPLGALGIIAGIATDKALLLSGQPTARVEHRVEVSVERVNSLVDALEVSAEDVSARQLPAGK